MKKFKGFVNGVTYDNEKNYRKAVSEAVGAGEVNAHFEYVEVVESDEPKKSEKPYQLTKEDMEEIRKFNKNYSQIKEMLSSDWKFSNFETVLKYL
jgi:uncharacterized protein YbaA (DUF1428 family)